MDDRDQRFRLIAPNLMNGLLVLDKRTGKTTRLLYPDGGKKWNENHFSARFLQDRSGAVWILTGYRLYRFLPENNRLEIPPQPALKVLPSGYNYFTQIAEDQQGNLWDLPELRRCNSNLQGTLNNLQAFLQTKAS